jgi:uncharacterized membrane protein (UPF0182 family)
MAEDSTPPPSTTRLKVGLTIATVALLFLVALPALADFYIDLRFFRSLGFEDVFTTVIRTQLSLFLAVGIGFALLLYANARIALKYAPEVSKLGPPEIVRARRAIRSALRRAVPLAALGLGLVAGLAASDEHMTYLQWANATPFGEADPLLGHDVGFYVYTLPFLEGVRTLLVWGFGLSLVLSGALHLLTGAVTIAGLTPRAQRPRIVGEPRSEPATPPRPRASRPARAHLCVLGALLFLALTFDAWLAIPELLFSGMGPVAGASYADANARLPMLQLKIGVGVLASVLIAIAATRKRAILIGAALVLYFGVDLLGVGLYPSLVHRLSVLPNEAEKEGPYIERNIEATRAGWGLGAVLERDLDATDPLTMADIEENHATIDNVRLWDHRPLLDTFAQIQEIRTYYEFASVDNDRYMIDGELRQIMLSPRELATESLPNRTWINERFTFTHGYGLTLGPVNKATPEGLPLLYVQDIPPVSTSSDLDITRPEIYYGELSNDHVFVDTGAREFDHPSGDENVYATYAGRGGIRLDSTLTELAFAFDSGTFKILLSDEITEDSRVLMHRAIHDRVQTLAPFLRYDRDPYMVVRNDGSLVWIQDAYTQTSRYPYSQPDAQGINYVRNSVKVVIDAYHGDVDFYVNDQDDPLIRTWKAIFPSLFDDVEAMPEDLQRHLRYPEDLFDAQTEMFTVYHMDDPQDVYDREDQWEVPSLAGEDGRRRMEPYYTVMRLPEEDEAELVLMIPYTPKSKANLAAWMVARNDGERRGELVVYRFPKDRLVFGPQQIMNRIHQDAEISRQVSLWDQRGSQAIFGTLLVIPVEESLLYVAPLYLRSESGRIPELKRVIVVYENRIAMEPTLEGAVRAIFGGEGEEAASADAEPPPVAATLEGGTEPTDAADPTDAATETGTETGGESPRAAAAKEAFERATAAQRAGDWAGYGAALEELEAILERLAAEEAAR